MIWVLWILEGPLYVSSAYILLHVYAHTHTQTIRLIVVSETQKYYADSVEDNH